MPIFEFQCQDCEKITEVLVKSGNAKKPVCQHCGSKNTKKQFSSFATHVKQSTAAPKSGCMSCENQGCPHAGRL